jgi:hypothetical protein
MLAGNAPLGILPWNPALESWDLTEICAADVTVPSPKGNRRAAVFPSFTTVEYGIDTMCARDHDN